MRSPAQMEVSKCVRDYKLYPRHEMDPTNVRFLLQGLESGSILPPIILDKESLRVVDGFHRVEAYLRYFGPTHQVGVDLRSYPSEAAIFEEAMLLNSSHGKRLSPYDFGRCIVVGRELGIADDRLAQQLHLTKERFEELVKDRIAIDPTTHLEREIKATCAHLAGRELTPNQIQGNERAGGMNAVYYIGQVVNLIENDVADWSNQRLVEGFVKLRRIITEALTERGLFPQ